MSLHDEIALLGMDLEVGERSTHLVCPACGGGPSQERSLLIWCDPGRLAYHCYRVKCGVRGVVGGKTGTSLYTPPKKLRGASTVDTLKPEPVPADVMNSLMEKFRWLSPHVVHVNRVMWDDRLERVLLPISTLKGEDEGYMARKYPELCLDRRNEGGPKCKAYFLKHITAPSCFMPSRTVLPLLAGTQKIVLMEDYWSALRAALSGIPAVPVSGTSINEQALSALLSAGIKQVVMVLDADAVAKASRMVQDYQLLFRMSFVPLWGKDVKDMSQPEYDKLAPHITEKLS